MLRLDFPWCLGFVWLRRRCGEILTVLAEIQEGVAVLAVERGEVTADEFDAADVVALRRNPWVGGLVVVTGRPLRLVSESLPGGGEVEVGILGAERIELLELVFLNGDLAVDEGGLSGDEAGFTPADGGEFIDEGLLDVALGVEGGTEAFEVELEFGFLLDADDVVDGGGEAVFDGVAAGAGFAVDGDGAFGFGAVEAGLFGAGHKIVREFLSVFFTRGSRIELRRDRSDGPGVDVIDFVGKILLARL